MLKISGPSRITQETADFSKKKQGCIYYKHVRRSDLIPERKSSFFNNDGGNEWFSWEKN